MQIIQNIKYTACLQEVWFAVSLLFADPHRHMTVTSWPNSFCNSVFRSLFSLQTAMDQLHMHFTQAIHNTVFQVVLGYVELCAGNADTKFQKMQYKDLCTVRRWVCALVCVDGRSVPPVFTHSVCTLTAFWPEKIQSPLLDASVKTIFFSQLTENWCKIWIKNTTCCKCWKDIWHTAGPTLVLLP